MMARAVWRALAGLIALLGPCTSYAAPDPEDIVVMLGARTADGQFDSQLCAAGIIVSQTSERTLILTAEHVLGKIRKASEADPDVRYEITAEFAWLRGKLVVARPVPGLASVLLDYALLSVEAVDAPPIPDAASLAVLGDLQGPDGKPRSVIEIGNPGCRRWERPVTPQPVVASSAFEIKVESRFTSEGSSGGALFTDGGALVGMLIASDGSFTTVRPIPLLLEQLEQQRISVSLTPRQFAAVPEDASPPPLRRGPPIASRFDRSGVRVSIASRDDRAFQFRVDPSLGTDGIKEIRISGPIEARLTRVGTILTNEQLQFLVPTGKALSGAFAATYAFDDGSVAANIPIGIRATLEPLIRKLATTPGDWIECSARSRLCQLYFRDDADRLLDHVEFGAAPDNLSYRLYPRSAPPASLRLTDYLGRGELHLPTRDGTIHYQLVLANGERLAPARYTNFASTCAGRECDRQAVYEMVPERPGQPPISYGFAPALEAGQGSRDYLRWHFPPGLEGAAIEVDPDGRGFLPSDAQYADPGRRLVLRFTLRDGTRVGPYAYTLDLDAAVLAEAREQPLNFVCGLSSAGQKRLCFVNSLTALLTVRQVAIGTEPDRLTQVLRPGFPKEKLYDREWRKRLTRCHGALYNDECLALWREAGGVVEIAREAKDLYVQVDRGGVREEISRLPL
jgi:hypothetical protein